MLVYSFNEASYYCNVYYGIAPRARIDFDPAAVPETFANVRSSFQAAFIMEFARLEPSRPRASSEDSIELEIIRRSTWVVLQCFESCVSPLHY